MDVNLDVDLVNLVKRDVELVIENVNLVVIVVFRKLDK